MEKHWLEHRFSFKKAAHSLTESVCLFRAQTNSHEQFRIEVAGIGNTRKHWYLLCLCFRVDARKRGGQEHLQRKKPQRWIMGLTIHTYIHTYIHTFIQTERQTDSHTYIHAYVHTYIHACMHTYIHTHMHTCIHEHVCMYIYI